MPAKRNCRTYRNTASAQKPPVFQGNLLTEEPIRRYPHPIPQAVHAAETAPVVLTGDASAALAPTMTQVLEQLELQSQLLVDLLAAINALTAATLAQANKV